MDRFLASLQLYGDNDIFVLTGFRSISIRDQMIRGAMVARALPRWLGEHYGPAEMTPPVLVAGAGVAGMTVALGLARQGLRVEVLNPSGQPFGLQLRSLRDHWLGPDDDRPAEHWTRGRWIDPLQYDWPMEHWRGDRDPYTLDLGPAKEQFPFAFRSGRAADLARGWEATLLRFHQDPAAANLVIHDGWYLSEFPVEVPSAPGRPFHATIKPRDPDGGRDYSNPFSAVIQANGAGDEKVGFDHSPDFTSLGFWDPDPFEDPTYGGKVQQDDVLISGTGDGGLQDLLQVLTRRRSARESYEELEREGLAVNLDLIHSVEARHDRAATWANHPRAVDLAFQLAPYLDERHWAYRREVDRLLANPQVHRCVLNHVKRRPRTTWLVSAAPCFEPLYGLNLFLAMLLVQALRTHPDDAVRGSMRVALNRRLVRIEPHGWAAPPPERRLSAADCLGKSWAVTLDGEEGPVHANVVIVRQGLGPNSWPIAVAGADPRVFPRPMTPVHLHS